jgi:hypothetical protein
VIPPPENSRKMGLLQDRLVRLAGTPDDSSRIGTDLIVVAQLAASLIDAIDHASVTARSGGAYVTVAASSDVAVDVDQAQYDDKAGPCLEALEAEYPAAVPDIAAVMTWPGFRDTAVQLGLKTSLSIPLFAGSGTTIATLNLYSSESGALTPLTAAVWAAYDPDGADPWSRDALDPGGRELTAGLIGAMGLRSMIQRAIDVLAAGTDASPDRAYLALRMRAAEAGVSLTDAAAHVNEQGQT